MIGGTDDRDQGMARRKVMHVEGAVDNSGNQGKKKNNRSDQEATAGKERSLSPEENSDDDWNEEEREKGGEASNSSKPLQVVGRTFFVIIGQLCYLNDESTRILNDSTFVTYLKGMLSVYCGFPLLLYAGE